MWVNKNNSLIEILRDEEEKAIIEINVINKNEVISGYYFNKDKTAIVCINGQGCQDVDNNYYN